MALPSAGSDLLHGGLVLDPASIVCPTDDFETWVPFIRRQSDDYTTDPRFGGFDDDCVPQIDLQGRYGGVGVTQTPLVVANYALLRYGDLLRGVEPEELPLACRGSEAAVITQAEWLADRAVIGEFDGVEHWSFPYDFRNIQGEIDPPWSSGYAHGVIAPAFVAAWCVSADPRWLEAATGTLSNMVIPMGDGGAATWTGVDSLWFEEVAAPTVRSARSLNGHLGAAAGVATIAQWTGSPGMTRLRDFAFNAALRELEAYDVGFISLYTQWALSHPFIAPALDYNRFHVQQLSWVHELTGDTRALDMALRFARYDDPGWTWTAEAPFSGSLDFVKNLEYTPRWAAPSPAVLEVDLGREQTVTGLILWSPDPAERPATVAFEGSVDGENWTRSEAAWSPGCNDTELAIAPTRARYGRVVLSRPDGADVALQAIGVVRERGNPTGVAQWQLHGVHNRPAQGFGETGWVWSRLGGATFDLDGAFDDGMQVVMTGWRGLPTPSLTVASELAGPWEEVAATPSLEDGTLTWSFPTVGFEYLRIAVDTPSTPSAEHRLFIRH